MKVLILSGIYPPELGGPATHAVLAASALRKQRMLAGIAAYVPPGEKPGYSPSDPGVYFVARAGAFWRRYLAYERAAYRLAAGADAVYLLDTISAGAPGMVAALRRGLPYALRVSGDAAWEIAYLNGWVKEGVDEFQTRRYAPRVEVLKTLRRMVARRARRVIVPSAYLTAMARGWGVPQDRLRVIPNPAPLDYIFSGKHKGERRFILAGGRMTPHKGFETLIKAFSRLKKEFPDLYLILAGDGPMRPRLVELAYGVGWGEAVLFPGALPRKEWLALLAQAKVFALNSNYEGHSFSVLEALFARTPVVASRVGGHLGLLCAEENALLVPPDDETAFYLALRRILTDVALKRRLIREGEKTAKEYSPDAAESSLTELFLDWGRV